MLKLKEKKTREMYMEMQTPNSDTYRFPGSLKKLSNQKEIRKTQGNRSDNFVFAILTIFPDFSK